MGVLVARLTGGLRPVPGAVLTAVVWTTVAIRFGWSLTLLPEFALGAGLVPLAVIDRRTLTLPRRIVYVVGAAVAVGVAVAAVGGGGGHRALVAGACAVGELGVFGALYLISPSSLGFGDVRLAPVIGLALGWVGVTTVVAGALLAFVTAAVVGVALLATGRATRKTALPFGVFLALGAVLGLVVT